jgi:hypothetical protein
MYSFFESIVFDFLNGNGNAHVNNHSGGEGLD